PGRKASPMFQPDTQFLIDHWAALSQAPSTRGGIPSRAALEPQTLGLRLPRTFLADRLGETPCLRLAGGWIEAFHGEPLRDRPFFSLWTGASRALIGAAVTQSVREARPVVVVATVGAAGSHIEVVLAPLRGPSGEPDRILGLYAPSETLALTRDESRLLTARLSVGAGAPARAPLSLAAVGGRRLA
ncbi:MAG TPA: PAS domain-containing protein, partial [Brevundimonas sp.]|nr:PAS domain-containing protein [Brevundimonas sp.]